MTDYEIIMIVLTILTLLLLASKKTPDHANRRADADCAAVLLVS
ncbi:MAG: hypothetical protein Q4G52_09400 [Clostridia bacterium]|nr:hypothetical protein [Clostridia bacterium]